MKKLILSLIVLAGLSGCTEVYFEQPQPVNVNPESSFPLALRGSYLDENKDTLWIGEKNWNLGDTATLLHFSGELSKNQLIKVQNDTYFMSHRSENLWNVVIAKLETKNRLVVNRINGDELKIIEHLKEITKVKEIKNDDGEIDHYIINPSDKELAEILRKGVFSKAAIFKRITN